MTDTPKSKPVKKRKKKEAKPPTFLNVAGGMVFWVALAVVAALAFVILGIGNTTFIYEGV